MKTLQEQYNTIKTGKGDKNQFLKQARLLFPEYFNQYTNYDNAVSTLKSKQIINETAGGVVSKGFDIFDWKKILAEETKAVEKETSKEVLDDQKNNYDNKDMKNADNVNFNEIMKGFYCEMKDEKNKDKTGDELKAMVVKNLAKDPLFYTKNGEFGVKDLGYTTEAPGLGEPKEPKGKHKSSGYGDLKEGYDSKAGLSKKEQDKISDLSKEEKKALNDDLTDAMSDINNQDFKDKASYAKTMKAAKTKVYKKHNILQENTDKYEDVLKGKDSEEAEAYLQDQGLSRGQIEAILRQYYPKEFVKETTSEQKLRSLIRNVIQEELNKEDYKTKLRDLERPHTKDKKALEDIIDIYNSQIQGLDSIKKNINEGSININGKTVKTYTQNGDTSYNVTYDDGTKDIIYVNNDGWDEINQLHRNAIGDDAYRKQFNKN